MIRERNGSVTAWLVVWIVWNVLGFIFNFTGSSIGTLFGGNTSNLSALGIISIINIICYILIFNWKFIGVIGKILTSVADLIINIIEYGKMGKAFDSVGSTFFGSDFGFSSSFKWLGFIRFFLFIGLFISVLCKKYNGQPSTWDYLLGYSHDKLKQEAKKPNMLIDTLIFKNMEKCKARRNIDILEKPSIESNFIFEIKQNDVVTLLDKGKDISEYYNYWCYIENEKGLKGWCSSVHLKNM